MRRCGRMPSLHQRILRTPSRTNSGTSGRSPRACARRARRVRSAAAKRAVHHDTSIVSSDILRLVALCDEAKTLLDDEAKAVYRQARALYGGDILIERPYERLDERDDSGMTLLEVYREIQVSATRELADLHLRDGEPTSAIALYRELLRGQSAMENLVRALFRYHRRLGDRNALIWEVRHLREVLREIAAAEGKPTLAEPELKTSALFLQALDEIGTREATTAAHLS